MYSLLRLTLKKKKKSHTEKLGSNIHSNAEWYLQF